MLSSVYDPLRFILLVILPAKSLMQDLCKLKLNWDDEVPVLYWKKWQQWKELPKLQEVQIDRCFKPVDFGASKKTQVHNFNDASEIGYGTVSYLRMENDRGQVHCSFLLAKSCVAPLKQVFIPRLELTVAVRVNHLIIQKELEMPIHDTYFWTDSMSVLRYIKNESARFQTFVAIVLL